MGAVAQVFAQRVGKRASVAPPVEEDKDLEEYGEDVKPGDKGVQVEGLEVVREGLQDAIDRLQEVSNELSRITD